MHEATKKLINYVRLRIDEEEEKWILKRHGMALMQENLSVSVDLEKESLSGCEEIEQEIPHSTTESEDEEQRCDSLENDGEEPHRSLSHDEETHEGGTQMTESDASATDSLDYSSASLEQPFEKHAKAYVLLLHFPPSVSQRACYPALFLYGWDYHYLDSLVASTECAVPLKYVSMHCLRLKLL